MKLTLHVGLPKTATSSIQHALTVSKTDLAARGVIYPGTTAAHHQLARAINGAEDGRRRMAQVAETTLDDMVAEVRAARARHVVISSEHLILVSEPAVGRLRAMLDARFPATTEVLILCYVREPVAFATSMCQQEVKSGKIRLAEFYADPWPFQLANRMQAFATAFGEDSLRLRQFDPRHLKNGDVIDDFLDAIGEADFEVPEEIPQMNRALTAEGVLVADALTGIRPSEARKRFRRRQYKRLLEGIEGGRFVLPNEVQARIIDRSAADLAALNTRFGLTLVPRLQEVADSAPPDPADALAMARDIAAQVEG